MTALGSRAHDTVRSLRVRNYRLYFYGQIVSLIGTWMQSVGQAWLVLRITGSGVALGVTMALQFLPVLLLGAWGGVIADCFDKRRVLVWTQSLSAVLALALGILTITGTVELWMVYVLALALGLVTVADNPSRQTFVMEMVGKDHVTNAVSLNSVTFTGARIVGPAIAAALIATGGLGLCFLINAASYIAVIAGLLLMRKDELLPQPRAARARGQIREGFRYAWSNPLLRRLLLLAAVIYTFSFNFSVIMPLLAERSFSGGAGTYGILLSVTGVGSLLGGLAMAGHSKASERLIVAAALATGLLEGLAAVVPQLWMEVVVLIPLGFVLMVLMAGANSALQLTSDGAFRGRVMALYAMVFLGSTPIGGPLAGWTAEHLGPRAALGIGGAFAVIASLVAMWAMGIRHRGALLTLAENRRGGEVPLPLPDLEPAASDR
ncbi:MAG: MFS transporter [Actinomycetota bacterium]|nr:MFS transporter [Actinomycetota bacterium]